MGNIYARLVVGDAEVKDETERLMVLRTCLWQRNFLNFKRKLAADAV